MAKTVICIWLSQNQIKIALYQVNYNMLNVQDSALTWNDTRGYSRIFFYCETVLRETHPLIYERWPVIYLNYRSILPVFGLRLHSWWNNVSHNVIHNIATSGSLSNLGRYVTFLLRTPSCLKVVNKIITRYIATTTFLSTRPKTDYNHHIFNELEDYELFII